LISISGVKKTGVKRQLVVRHKDLSKKNNGFFDEPIKDKFIVWCVDDKYGHMNFAWSKSGVFDTFELAQKFVEQELSKYKGAFSIIQVKDIITSKSEIINKKELEKKPFAVFFRYEHWGGDRRNELKFLGNFWGYDSKDIRERYPELKHEGRRIRIYALQEGKLLKGTWYGFEKENLGVVDIDDKTIENNSYWLGELFKKHSDILRVPLSEIIP
jgi:hypothetical protein